MKQAEIKAKILKVLEKNPRGLLIREIAELVGMSRVNITKYIYALVAEGLIVRRKAGGRATLCYLSKRKRRKGFASFLFSACLLFLIFAFPTHAQVQSHPLSQITPIDTNLDMFSYNITNVSFIGIGIVSPTYPLHVAGNVYWTGTLLGGTVPWARLTNYPSIIAGSGLTGGGDLSTSRTLSVATGGITNAMIALQAVNKSQISGILDYEVIGNLYGENITAGTIAVARLPAEVVLTTGSYADPSWITSLSWSKLQNYPAGCSAGQAVQVIDDTLTCVDITSQVQDIWVNESGDIMTGTLTFVPSSTGANVIVIRNTTDTVSRLIITEDNKLKFNDTVNFPVQATYIDTDGNERQIFKAGGTSYGGSLVVGDRNKPTTYLGSTIFLDPGGSGVVGYVEPAGDNIKILGSSTKRWKQLWISEFVNVTGGNITNVNYLNPGGSPLYISSSTIYTPTLRIRDSSGTYYIEDWTGTLKNIRSAYVYANNLVAYSSILGDNIVIRPNSASPTVYISFQSYDGSSWKSSAVLRGGYLELSRAKLTGNLNASNFNITDVDRIFANKLEGALDWSNLQNYPSGCGEGQAVRIIGDKLTCIDLSQYGNVTGTGASGQIAFWTGTSTISGDSELYWDDTNKRLGIGTSSPAYKLSVVGTGGSGIALYSGSTLIAHLRPDATGDAVFTLADSAGTTKIFISGEANENIYFNNGGNLGIGTTSPGRKLDVTDRIRIRTGGAGTAGIWFANSTGTEMAFVGLQSDVSGSQKVGLWVPTGGWSLIVKEGGYVGIGTTNPGTIHEGVTSKLEVKGTGHTAITIDSPTNYVSSFILSEAGNSAWQLLSRGDAGDRFEIYAANGTSVGAKVTILQTGEVGIGTTSPAQELHVYRSSGNVELRTQSGSYYADFGSGSGGHYVFGYGAIPLYFGTNGQERMRIDSNGNVGIGTTSPSEKLEVNGNVKLSSTDPYINMNGVAIKKIGSTIVISDTM
jgi:DNA-binding transcriptional ArsR family regulator